MSGEHWYSRDGRTAYETNGRGTTLRDARKLFLVPSVTTVLSVIDKPALTNWLVDQGIMAALTMPRCTSESEPQYIARIKADSKAQAIAAAAEGSRIHDACEQHVKGLVIPQQYLPHATAARAELARLFPGIDDWIAEKSFAHPLGFGGKCDLHSPSTGLICDYKTKDGDFTDGKKLAWDQHWQLAAYQIGLNLTRPYRQEDALGNKKYVHDTKAFFPGAAIFVSRTHPGSVVSHVWGADEMAQGWAVFAAALELWKRVKQFDGSF